MIRPMRSVAVLMFLAMFTGQAEAQVQARQGEEEQTQFRSPMILDLPLAIRDPELWGKGQVRSKNDVSLRKYSCEGVSILDLASGAKRQRDGTVKITFDFVLKVDSGMDKLVSVKFALMTGEQELVSRVRNDIDAEEGRIVNGQVSLLVPEATLTADPPPTLRIQVKVADNP